MVEAQTPWVGDGWYDRRPWERAASASVSLFDPPGVAFSYLVIIKSMTHTRPVSVILRSCHVRIILVGFSKRSCRVRICAKHQHLQLLGSSYRRAKQAISRVWQLRSNLSNSCRQTYQTGYQQAVTQANSRLGHRHGSRSSQTRKRLLIYSFLRNFRLVSIWAVSRVHHNDLLVCTVDLWERKTERLIQEHRRLRRDLGPHKS